MDKYLKCVKRQSTGDSKEPCGKTTSSKKQEDIRDFYFPESSRSDSSTNMTDHPIVPGAPQKPCDPDSAMMTALPEMADYWTKRTGQRNHPFVSRRLQFDDDDKVIKRKVNLVNNSMDNANEEIHTLFEKKMNLTATAKNPRFCSVVESITGRGFIVTKVLGRSPQSDSSSAGTTEEECCMFECVSALEGIAYCVQASVTANRGRYTSSVAAASTLSAVGPHPNIVAFHSIWSDARYHYMQTELCPENLCSPSGRYRLNSGAEYRTVVEHVACALHYLHVCKGYAHNQVNGGNVYPVCDAENVVYKLGGFDGATRLTHADAGPASLADVKSLCSSVSLLMEERGGDADDEDLMSLRSYLSYVIRKIDYASGSAVGWTAATDVNAFAVWRWCCAARQQHGERPRQMFGNGSSEDDVGPMDTAEATIPVSFDDDDGPPQRLSQ